MSHFSFKNMIRSVKSRLFEPTIVHKKKKTRKERLDLGTDQYKLNPGPGSYDIISSPLEDTTKISIKEKFPLQVDDPTRDVDFYTPPPMQGHQTTIGNRGSLTYFDENDTPFYAPVLPSTLNQSKYTKIHERITTKEPNSDIPGPGQYTPITVSTRIKTSMGKYRGREPLWEGDNGVPGPGKYNVTKSYPKPSNWTDFLRKTKPVQPVHYLKREPPGSIKKKSFRPIVL